MNKDKIKKMIDKLGNMEDTLSSGELRSVADDILNEQFSSMSKQVKDSSIVKYLDKLNAKLVELKTEFNLGPVLASITEVQDEIESIKESVTSESENTKIQSEKKYNELLNLVKNNRGELEDMTNRQIKALLERVRSLQTQLSYDSKNATQQGKSLKEIMSQFESRLGDLSKDLKQGMTVRESSEGTLTSQMEENSRSIKGALETIGELRKDLTRFSNARGGSANRQINVKSSVMSRKFTDINFVQGNNVTLTAADDNTNKRVNITIAASGGAGGDPGGDDTQVQFNDEGAFGGAVGVTWNKNTSVFSANNVEIDPNRRISSVLTVNNFFPTYSGADATIAHANANFSSVATALATTSTIGGTYYLSDGAYTESSIVALRSATRLNLSQGATIQTDGSTNPILIQTSTAGLSRVVIDGGKLLQTNATAQGVAISLDNTPNAWVSRMRIEEFGTGIQANDTGNTTFYNSARDIQMFNVNNGISLGGTQPNMNIWDNVRIRPKTGGGGIGVNLIGSVRGNTFINVDVEPANGTGITGVHLQGDSRDNLFVGNWLENNENGVVLDAGSTNNGFVGGTITDNITADIVDNGTGNWFWGVNKTGRKLFKIPNVTDTTGKAQLTFTENSGVVRFGQPSSLIGGIEIAGSIVGVVKVQAASTAGNWTMTLPPNDGSANQVLTTDGNGITTWASVAGGAAGNPAGDDTEFQFNDGGSFGGASVLTWNKNSSIIQANNVTIDGVNNRVGIGTNAPTRLLDIMNGDVGITTTVESASSFTNVFQKIRVNTSVLQNNDKIGEFLFKGYDGAAYRNAAGIKAEVDGTPGSSDMPGRLVLSTTPDGSATFVQRMVIDSTGVTTVGLQGSVAGAIKFAGLTTGTVQVQPASVAGNWTMTLPANDGSANQVLTTDGNGVTTWASVAATGGSGITRNVSIITADTTAADSANTDYVYFAEAGMRFTLPTAVDNKNLYTLKNNSNSSVLVLAPEGVDGSATALMPNNNESLSFMSNNSVWGVV